jgi:hypothetical protein
MNKKKPIPNVLEILEALDKESKFSIKKPEQAKERAVIQHDKTEQEEGAAMLQDFSAITLGDYISAAHSFNREMMGSNVGAHQKAAYFTLFAFEERAKRMEEHYTYIN